ncbi:MAG TPA: class I SAM-dependent methyltransferase [Oligoflexia bacterium]|nr:class I SAM-dependent methyltransferase [Oligoflexia bacterium]HMR25057.1 class I SAM-dependent methyltransferase [Oligoflexia bacterium]
MQCPLCSTDNQNHFSVVNEKLYYDCHCCGLVYLDRRFYLSEQEEKQRYLSHENNPKDPRYQTFLQPAVDSLLPYLKNNCLGLDFGCGNGSPLAHMFAQYGHKLYGYDPFFYPDQERLNTYYDFIVSTETFEHLHQPKQEFKRLLTCLNKGGYICVMTQFLIDKADFERWYYHRDPSHTLFFNTISFQYLAQMFDCAVSFPQKNIALFKVE